MSHTYHDLVALVAGQVAAGLAAHYPLHEARSLAAHAVDVAREIVNQALRLDPPEDL